GRACPKTYIPQEREIARVESRVLRRAERVCGRDTRERPRLEPVADVGGSGAAFRCACEEPERVVRGSGQARGRAGAGGVCMKEGGAGRGAGAGRRRREPGGT